MNYEEKYKEALERAKRLRDSYYQTMNAKRVVEEIFPELAESEDEKIRKWLYNMVENLGYPADEAAEKELEEMQPLALAYLERQKEPENVSATTMAPSCWEVEQKEQKPAEWSEEDEHRRKDAIYFLESAKKHYADTSEIEKTIAWLKSLRPARKPSEEQMEQDYPSSTEMITEWETNELPMLREKDFRGDAERMAYNAFMDGFAKGLGYKK